MYFKVKCSIGNSCPVLTDIYGLVLVIVVQPLVCLLYLCELAARLLKNTVNFQH